MRFPTNPIPTYTRYVLTTSFQAGISLFLFVWAWVAMMVIVFRGFVPDIKELADAGTHYLALLGYGVGQFFMIYIQNERWQELFRKPPPQPAQRFHEAPRPIAQTFEAMAHNSRTMVVGVRSMLPPTVEHYAELYRKLERNDWRITRRAINVKVGDVPAFTALTERYSKIIGHWEKMGWVDDGYLSESGQEHFAELGHVDA